jgi:hypothetical protein
LDLSSIKKSQLSTNLILKDEIVKKQIKKKKPTKLKKKINKKNEDKI